MSLISGFDANDQANSNVVPDKTQVTCVAIEAEDTESKNSPGNWMLKVKFEVVEDGPFKGMFITERFNLLNSNETAQRIGKAAFQKFCLAIGVPKPQANSELLNRPFRATCGKPQEFLGELQSHIQKYDPDGGSSAAADSLSAGKAAGAAKPPAWAVKKTAAEPATV